MTQAVIYIFVKIKRYAYRIRKIITREVIKMYVRYRGISQDFEITK